MSISLIDGSTITVENFIVLINDNYFEFNGDSFKNPKSEFWKQIRKGGYMLNYFDKYIPEKAIVCFYLMFPEF